MGKWENEANDHVPQVRTTVESDLRVLIVDVPLDGTSIPLHYIEAIILTDHNKRELQKVTFTKGNRRAAARFTLQADHRSFVYVIVKCNLHDMWEKRVVW